MTNNNENIGQGTENQEGTTELSLETPEQEATRLATFAEEVVAENQAAQASFVEKSEEEDIEIARLTTELHAVMDGSRADYARGRETLARAVANGNKEWRDKIPNADWSKREPDRTAEDFMREDAEREDHRRTSGQNNYVTAEEKKITELKSKLGL